MQAASQSLEKAKAEAQSSRARLQAQLREERRQSETRRARLDEERAGWARISTEQASAAVHAAREQWNASHRLQVRAATAAAISAARKGWEAERRWGQHGQAAAAAQALGIELSSGRVQAEMQRAEAAAAASLQAELQAGGRG